MSAFDPIAAMPGWRSLFDLAWRLFGVNPALVSADGQQAVVFDPESRSQPFCAALQQDRAGRGLGVMCDQTRFLEARRSALALRYRCHAGLTEFIVPVIRNGEMIALLQCGQAHDRRPSTAEWRLAQQGLDVGTSVVEFILGRRIARARDLLRRTDHTCAEIAFEVGFGSVQHFSRIFRRHQDMSPARWRQQVPSWAPVEVAAVHPRLTPPTAVTP